MGHKWVIDATFGAPADGAFWFIPIEGELGTPDCRYVTGMSFGGDKPPHDGKCVGIIHEHGQEAAEAFYEKHKEHMAKFDFARVLSEEIAMKKGAGLAAYLMIGIGLAIGWLICAIFLEPVLMRWLG